MAAYCRVYGVIHFTSPAGSLPVHRDQLQAQRSVTSMGKLYLLTFNNVSHFRPHKLQQCTDLTLPSRYTAESATAEGPRGALCQLSTGVRMNEKLLFEKPFV